jgi:polysaccharide export outer membrane protein
MIKRIVVFIATVIVLSSCASNKNVLYIQNSSGVTVDNTLTYANVLQTDDNIIITVTSAEPELASQFNLMYLNLRSSEIRTLSDENLYTYLINQNGDIDFPVLGTIKIAGLTRIEAENKIKELLKKHIVDPGVSIRVINFKVSVLGEVLRAGSQHVVGDRVTLLEAISMAGDLTIYGNRKEIMIIREADGVKTISEVDITDANFINSPYYYLDHNDVVYVKPNKTRVNSSVIGPNITVGISALSLLITIIALSTR